MVKAEALREKSNSSFPTGFPKAKSQLLSTLLSSDFRFYPEKSNRVVKRDVIQKNKKIKIIKLP